MATDMLQIIDDLIEKIKELPETDQIQTINQLNDRIADIHPIQHPVNRLNWIPMDDIIANDYNPNVVAPPEMGLLHTSVREDGYTMPIVVAWDEDQLKFMLGDGYHRNRLVREYKDIRKSTKGYLPAVKVHKTPEELRALTIRHNRARGKHTVSKMADIVAYLIKHGQADEQIATNLGMDADEVLRLKQQTGIAELFRNREYSRSWE
ncbi:IbrB-like domain-containing protein [Paenibacillus sp. NRS-1783]|uniref:IbrB-like domain-containing protein n=1 Tax=Paenibacillus sp. NRS-1783 TaxID=3233907 RepID=UPI003D2E352C